MPLAVAGCPLYPLTLKLDISISKSPSSIEIAQRMRRLAFSPRNTDCWVTRRLRDGFGRSGVDGRIQGVLVCRAAKNRQLIRGIAMSSAIHIRIHPPITLDGAENRIEARGHCISLCVYNSPICLHKSSCTYYLLGSPIAISPSLQLHFIAVFPDSYA